jgi:hypothetical protein
VLSENVERVVDADEELDCEDVSISDLSMAMPKMKDLLLVLKLQQTPATTPRMMLAQGVMKPDAGVAATRPEMVPEHQPTMDHFLARRKSRRHQVMAANMAVRHEFQQAMTARRLAPKADPPLNPSHPNHRRTVPRVMREMLWGRKFIIIFSFRRPRTQE